MLCGTVSAYVDNPVFTSDYPDFPDYPQMYSFKVIKLPPVYKIIKLPRVYKIIKLPRV